MSLNQLMWMRSSQKITNAAGRTSKHLLKKSRKLVWFCGWMKGGAHEKHQDAATMVIVMLVLLLLRNGPLKKMTMKLQRRIVTFPSHLRVWPAQSPHPSQLVLEKNSTSMRWSSAPERSMTSHHWHQAPRSKHHHWMHSETRPMMTLTLMPNVPCQWAWRQQWRHPNDPMKHATASRSNPSWSTAWTSWAAGAAVAAVHDEDDDGADAWDSGQQGSE